MLAIYQYTQPHVFLKDRWKIKKQTQPQFSLRALAYKMGLKSNSPLSEMFSGKRPIPKRYLPVFIDSFQLSAKEGAYLEILLDLSREKNTKAQEFFLNRLKALEPKANLNLHQVESFKLLGEPLCTILLEMTELKNFDSDPKTIQSRLLKNYSLDEIRTSIELLLSQGLLRKSPTGKLEKTHTHLTNKPDIADLGSQEYHRKVCALAAEAVGQHTVQKREFNGYAINVDPARMPEMKAAFRDFVQNFATEFECKPKTGKSTFQLNVQFFPLTKEIL